MLDFIFTGIYVAICFIFTLAGLFISYSILHILFTLIGLGL